MEKITSRIHVILNGSTESDRDSTVPVNVFLITTLYCLIFFFFSSTLSHSIDLYNTKELSKAILILMANLGKDYFTDALLI